MKWDGSFKSSRIGSESRRTAALWRLTSTHALDLRYCIAIGKNRQNSVPRRARWCGVVVLAHWRCWRAHTEVIAVEIKSGFWGFPWNLTRDLKVFGDDRVPSRAVEGNTYTFVNTSVHVSVKWIIVRNKALLSVAERRPIYLSGGSGNIQFVRVVR